MTSTTPFVPTRYLILAVALAASALPATASAQVCYQQPFSNVGSRWGEPRGKDEHGRQRYHRGVDFPVGSGTPVPSVADGVVVRVTRNWCLGNVVIIQHADGMFSSFSHLQSASVEDGDTVRLGQIVAVSGNTGSGDCTTGPHVHMVLSYNVGGYFSSVLADTVDPISYMAARSVASGCGGCVGQACGVAFLHEQPSAYAPPNSTDINGDGRADICARGGTGVRCWLAEDGGWSEETPALPWSDERGWDAVSKYSTLRMGDVDGDGRADICARSSSAGFLCALSNGAGFDAHTAWHPGFLSEDAWNQPQYYTTLRLADINGDGRQDLCGRSSGGIDCYLSDGTGFTTVVEGPGLSDAQGWDDVANYGTIRFGDIDGDGRDDLCARGGAGMRCWLSEGDGFGPTQNGPGWSDERGWDKLRFWSTIRLADIDGDGRQDICARSGTDLRCHQSLGDGTFATSAWIVAGFSDASGWNDVSNYATIRVGDIDGDGADDLCARSNARITCYAARIGADGEPTFENFRGPEWSDDAGWRAAQFYQTIRMADVDGDAMLDVCTRTSSDWRCHLATGDGFAESPVRIEEFATASGWSNERYWSTMMSGGPTCRPRAEECNGRDDDCDGIVDESVCGSDAGVSPDASLGADASFGADASVGVDTGPSTPPVGCSCAVGAQGSGPARWLLLLVGWAWRRRILRTDA